MRQYYLSSIYTTTLLLASSIFFVQCVSTNPMTTSEEVVTSSSNNSLAITYQKDIRPIVENYCTSCHTGQSPAAGLDLTSYEGVRNAAEFGSLPQRINDHKNPMPITGLLPKHMRQTFTQWATGGYINGETSTDTTKLNYDSVPPAIITPIDINVKGFDLLEKMQGHWVGSMDIMSDHYDWFAFDYRAIGPAHVHGIFEGGTMGNLFTSFFVTDYKGTRTIMARNGGLLNGIYRTSYFLLDRVEYSGNESYYRLVDAYAGEAVMYMELTFKNDELRFKSYTSSFGSFSAPRRHMDFKAKRMQMELANAAAERYDFPRKKVDMDFSEGLPKPDWGRGNPQTSASYIWQEEGKTLEELAVLARDPYPLAYVPNVGSIVLQLKTGDKAERARHLVYLSKDPLTKEDGQLYMERFDSVLSFPEINPGNTEFTFTYLHPGNYYLTVVSDLNDDHYPSKGDFTHKSMELIVLPKTSIDVTVSELPSTID